MPHYLLTGAGFSRNWGGWLASEAFEYLIGCKGLHPRIRTLLWKHKDRGGFEAVYQALKDGATNSTDAEVFRSFHMMVSGMFHTMTQGYESALIGSNVWRFLASFDAIFTLNQDTLLEQKFPGDDHVREMSSGTFLGRELPGLRGPTAGEFIPTNFVTPVEPPYALTDRKQPYFKLHGSSNWVRPGDTDLMLIVGGNKKAEIAKQPLLKWYHEQFQSMIKGAKVVIIGYSFMDDHINEYLTFAASQGTRYFIVDPSGVDIIDKRVKGPGMIPIPPTDLMNSLTRASH